MRRLFICILCFLMLALSSASAATLTEFKLRVPDDIDLSIFETDSYYGTFNDFEYTQFLQYKESISGQTTSYDRTASNGSVHIYLCIDMEYAYNTMIFNPAIYASHWNRLYIRIGDKRLVLNADNGKVCIGNELYTLLNEIADSASDVYITSDTASTLTRYRLTDSDKTTLKNYLSDLSKSGIDKYLENQNNIVLVTDFN